MFLLAPGDVQYLVDHGIIYCFGVFKFSAIKGFPARTENKVVSGRSLGGRGGLEEAPEC